MNTFFSRYKHSEKFLFETFDKNFRQLRDTCLESRGSFLEIGAMAEWLRRGLQSLVLRFEPGWRLQIKLLLF